MFYRFLYNLFFVPVMKLLLPVLSMFMPKLKKRRKDCKKIFDNASIERNTGDKVIWVHSASMGEFEQARSIIENLKKKHKNIKILVSFFSPSGYENRKDYSYADAVVYLPDDTVRNAKNFLDKFRPDACIFIRYEIWHNFLHTCNKRNIPAILIAATRPSKSKLTTFEPVKNFYAMNYSYFNKIYTVGKEHTEFFKSLDIVTEVITATDPRFDRIYEAVENNHKNGLLPKSVFENTFTLVAGSTWTPDENILIPALELLNKDNFKYRCIFVPHEPTAEHIDELKNKINAVLLSELTEYKNNSDTDENIAEKIAEKHIIVDSVGKLLALYSLADAAYVGGAFGAGVHSVTEPAGYGLPLATGPKMKNSPDAIELSNLKALATLRNKEDAIEWLEMLADIDTRKNTGETARNYIIKNRGTSDEIINALIQALYTELQ
jgi:3-deoxy-D-manno-octulosonic-acid transferase